MSDSDFCLLSSQSTGNCRCLNWNGSELSDGISGILGMSTFSPFKCFARINTEIRVPKIINRKHT